jgi:glycosyltransferase involved in cell wall biosynthesis
MNKKSPLVSIIVRTKDRPELLKRALQSIAVQTYRPIEVILVNDGGCDLNVKEIESILRDVSLNYIRLEENTGRSHAGNVGIKSAKGEYIGFLDDDDEFYPEHVMTLISFLSNQFHYKVAYTDTEMIFKEFSTEKTRMADVKKNIFSKDFSYNALLFGNYIPFNSIIFSREILDSTTWLDENLDLYEDWNFLIKIGQIYPFYHIKKLTAKYNQWSKDLQINQRDYNLNERVRLQIINKHRGKIPPEFLLHIWEDRERKGFRIADLENTMDLISDSMGWRFLIRIRKIREKLIPYGTKRRKIYDSGIKLIKSKL